MVVVVSWNRGVVACPSQRLGQRERVRAQRGLAWRAQWIADGQALRMAGAGRGRLGGLVAVRELMAGSQWVRLLGANPQWPSRAGPSTVKSVLAARTH